MDKWLFLGTHNRQPTVKRSKEHKEAMERVGKDLSIADMESQKDRARSISIGTAFGGTVEISMRTHGGSHAYSILQPVEAVELIHQLCAQIGCHINLTPRKDFASWRDWEFNEKHLAHHRGIQHSAGEGHPPQTLTSNVDESMEIATTLPPPEKQPGMKLTADHTEEKENVVAIEKTVNKSSTK